MNKDYSEQARELIEKHLGDPSSVEFHADLMDALRAAHRTGRDEEHEALKFQLVLSRYPDACEVTGVEENRELLSIMDEC